MWEALWFGADLPAETRTQLHWLSALHLSPATLFSGRVFFNPHRARSAAGSSTWMCQSPWQSSWRWRSAFMRPLRATLTPALTPLCCRASLLPARGPLPRRAPARSGLCCSQCACGHADDKRDAPLRSEALRRPIVLRRFAPATGCLSQQSICRSTHRLGKAMPICGLWPGKVEPARTFPGQTLYAGAINLSAPIEVLALAPPSQSLMADIARLVEAGGTEEIVLSPHRRQSGRRLCAAGPCDGRAGIRRVADGGRRATASSLHRRHRPDHHLYLRRSRSQAASSRSSLLEGYFAKAHLSVVRRCTGDGSRQSLTLILDKTGTAPLTYGDPVPDRILERRQINSRRPPNWRGQPSPILACDCKRRGCGSCCTRRRGAWRQWRHRPGGRNVRRCWVARSLLA